MAGPLDSEAVRCTLLRFCRPVSYGLEPRLRRDIRFSGPPDAMARMSRRVALGEVALALPKKAQAPHGGCTFKGKTH